jgi:hypothetical protein
MGVGDALRRGALSSFFVVRESRRAFQASSFFALRRGAVTITESVLVGEFIVLAVAQLGRLAGR